MPAKYVIHTEPAAHRFQPVIRSGVIAWEEGCLRCAVCVKQKCIYGVYDHRGLDPRQMIESLDNQCMNCLRCVQGCPGELIHKSIHPEYAAMGDAYWTPEIISSLWAQAQNGKIPVSGAGYHGPFSGPGFDAMWTDMSEIVRPTRDGIHGREYISTGIDLGRTPGHLTLNDQGNLVGEEPLGFSIPIPMILRVPAFGAISGHTLKGWALAARRLNTLLALPVDAISQNLASEMPWLMPLFPHTRDLADGLGGMKAMEIPWSEAWEEDIQVIKQAHASVLPCVGLPLEQGVEKKILALAQAGVPLVHLQGSHDGRFVDDGSRYLKEGIRLVHMALVEAGTRHRTTLLVSGGMALAEQVAKAVLCGADGVFLDFPLLIALECRMCRRCAQGLSCPVSIDLAEADWIARRVNNLMGAWHNQLLEVMGAMGIRDARRLRGEVGRAMFFEDLDQETFGSMGTIKEGCELE